jgi:hypothetical protein
MFKQAVTAPRRFAETAVRNQRLDANLGPGAGEKLQLHDGGAPGHDWPSFNQGLEALCPFIPVRQPALAGPLAQFAGQLAHHGPIVFPYCDWDRSDGEAITNR